MTQESPVNPPETIEKAKVEELIEKYKEEEQHELTSERGKVIYGSVIVDLEELL